MKKAIRAICLLLVIAMVLVVPVYAEDHSTRSSSYFAALQAYIYRTTDTQFQVWFDVTGTRRMEEIGVSEILVQRSVNNATWTTVATFTPDNYPQMLEYNTGTAVNYVPYTGSMYYYYRAYVTFYADNGSGWGKMSLYTSPVRLD